MRGGPLARLAFLREHRFTMRHAAAAAGGDLDAARSARVHAHAGRCPMCRELLRSLRATVLALADRRAPAPRAPDPARPVAEGVLERLHVEWGPP